MTANPAKGPVLVLDGEWASSLAIVRSLGKKGVTCHVASSHPAPLAASSKFCAQSFSYPDPLESASAFREEIAEKISETHYSLVIPVTERTIVPLQPIREEIESLSTVAMASSTALAAVLSKSRTFEIAADLCVPTPRSWVVNNSDDLGRLEDTLEFPVVLKPDRSKVWIDSERGIDLGVRYARTLEDLVDKLAGLVPFGPVILQEKVSGEGVGVAALAAEGEELFLFQYRRLHEVPLSGGASSYRISEELDEELAQYSRSLLKTLGWHGVAMIEFKRDPATGQVSLMEINGRFWGSLPLPVAAGADFPGMLYDMLVVGQESFSREYTIGTRCRNFERELRWFRQLLSAEGRESACIPVSFKGISEDSLRVLDPRHRWDELFLTDPKPGGRAILTLAQKLKQKIVLRAKKTMILVSMMTKRSRRHEQNRKMILAETILVICSGNIVRSPFAEFCLRKATRGTGRSVGSAGLDAIDGLSADPRACREAGARGIDLSAHAAKRVTHDLVAASDLILAMDITQIERLQRRYPESTGKTFLLRSFAPSGAMEISDPVEAPFEQFKVTFDLIESAVSTMQEALSQPLSPPKETPS